MASLMDTLALDRLPPAPTTLAHVVPLVTSPDSSLESLERAIRQDQALTATLLRLANSARYGSPGRQFDIRQAIARLGRDIVRRCVLEQQIFQVVARENKAFGLRHDAMWEGALGGAIAAEILAKEHLPKETSLAFLCGMLRDIGKLALDVTFGSDYWTLLSRHAKEGMSFCDVEQAAIGFDHARVGATLARRWKLPERIARVIELHHSPAASGPAVDRLVELVHAGDVIARWAGLGVGVDGLQYALAPHVRERFALDRVKVESLMASVWQLLHEERANMGKAVEQGAAA